MKLNHKYVDDLNDEEIDNKSTLCVEDRCIYCNLIIDQNIENMFQKLLDRHNLKTDISEYYKDINFCHKYVNEKFPCLTEEELLIKSLLE